MTTTTATKTPAEQGRVRSVFVQAYKRRDRNGNTYHSAWLHVNGEIVAAVQDTYGYGNAYQRSAAAELAKLGYIPYDVNPRGETVAPTLWQVCERFGIDLYDTCEGAKLAEYRRMQGYRNKPAAERFPEEVHV